MIITNTSLSSVIHTGLYGERAKQFFTWFRYELLENYEFAVMQYNHWERRAYVKPGMLGATGIVMHIEYAPDGEILLSSYPYAEGDLTDLPLSIINTVRRPIFKMTTVNDIWHLKYNYRKSSKQLFINKGNLAKQKEWLAIYIKHLATHDDHLSNIREPSSYTTGIVSTFSHAPLNKKLDRKCSDTRVKITTTDLSSLVGNKQACVDFYTAYSCTPASKYNPLESYLQDAPELNLEFTDAEIMFMFDYLLGRKIDRSKYKNVDFESFYGQPRSPIIAEMEIAYANLIKSAGEDYDRDLANLRRELDNEHSKEIEALRAKYKDIEKTRIDKLNQDRLAKIAEAKAMRQMIDNTIHELHNQSNDSSENVPTVLAF